MYEVTSLTTLQVLSAGALSEMKSDALDEMRSKVSQELFNESDGTVRLEVQLSHDASGVLQEELGIDVRKDHELAPDLPADIPDVSRGPYK